MAIIVTCLLCGLEEEHAARGLGERCYLKAKRLRMLGCFPRGRRAPEGKEPHRREYWREYKRSWYRARRRAA